MTAGQYGLGKSIVEKDYYVTMILKELAESEFRVVFKGGTSLSKAYHVIDRFSEDVDITFEEHLGSARRKKVKYNLLKPLSERLELPIDNWNTIESDKNYNQYHFTYDALTETIDSGLRSYVKLETALMSYAYPTEEREITSFIYEYLKNSDPDIIKEYGLSPFRIRTQTIERTLIDKLFAVCDYYINGRATRNSRHLYDIYKLWPRITVDDDFKNLVRCVRNDRAKIDVKVAPSAQPEIDIVKTAEALIADRFYDTDYRESTQGLITDSVSYKDAAALYLSIMEELF